MTTRFAASVLVTIFIVGMSGASAAADGGAASARSCLLRWRSVPVAAKTPKISSLVAVAARAPNDVWAVGSRGGDPGKSPERTLIERWDGKRWHVVRSPNVGTGRNLLSAVTAIARDDAWAVGLRGREGQAERALIERWNGRAWKIVPAPRVGDGGEELWGVAGTAAGDVWAVGMYAFGRNGSGPMGLIEHWDGKKWTAVTTPDLGNDFNGFNAVAARSRTDVWAVGSNNANPLIEHWDGTSWTVVPAVAAQGESYLNGVSVAPTGDVWAVGQLTIGPLVEHWDGARWTTPRIPRSHYLYLTAQQTNAVLSGVTAIRRNIIWATGYRLERWDGRQWHAGSTRTGGDAITALSSRDIWDVGGKRITHYACR